MSFDISRKLKDLAVFHIDSFNFVSRTGLAKACQDIDPVYTSNGVKITISDIVMRRLSYPMDARTHKRTVFPSEARLRLATYYAELDVQLRLEKGEDLEFCNRVFYVPVMIRSDLCYLHGLGPEDLVKVKEDINDPGGYFIVKGKERLIKHFVVQRRNFPLAIIQNKWKTLRKNYSEYGVKIRCVKDEHIFSTVSLHLLNDGSFEIRITHNLTSHFIQFMLVLKALVDRSDFAIVQDVLKYGKGFPDAKLKNMLHKLHDEGIHSHADAKTFIGKKFHPVLNLPPEASYHDATDYLFRKSLLVHLDNFKDKFEFMCFSLVKLHHSTLQKCRLDDVDNPAYQEVLSSGQIYLLMLKEGVASFLKSVRNVIQRKENLSFQKATLQRCCNQAISLTPQVSNMMATGNFPGKKFGLKTETGYTISLKRMNVFQLASQFTAISKFPVPRFLRQTRAYYPESWGFLCPTQTPEGENCGLHNYLASKSKIVDMCSVGIQERVVFRFGVGPRLLCGGSEMRPVLVDGKVVGWIREALCGNLILNLRRLKASDSDLVPFHSEIISISENEGLFPGIYLFSSPCRWVRQVLNTGTLNEEYIGILEQAFLRVVTDEASRRELQIADYKEIADSSILGLSAHMIPFFEHNEAVRNIFTSEKCKQAVGLPFYNFSGRSDAKTYQLVYGQSPVISTGLYFESNFDLYPNGTNVMVAVISYSGYDMEDAIVLNRASVERGLMHNVVYKTIYFDFQELADDCRCTPAGLEFKRDEDDPFISDFLDKDGLPFVGSPVKYNDPILSVRNKQTGFWLVKRYLERHPSYVQSVRLMGDIPATTKIPKNAKKISITFCVKKVPEEGDKFTNRHGGKGICGALMRQEDLPFTADGMVPDLLINPHSIPSRRSIGLLFEMATAKIKIHNADSSGYIVEPFESGQSQKTYDFIGEALAEAGFCSSGTETFYSGTSGLELEAEIFSGCMYYLRLCHMVEEKYQVHSVGAVDERTLQPINPGRSGAVRFGEMERDAILSHGAAELTRDRLLLCSDQCIMYVCSRCDVLVPPVVPLPMPELRWREEREFKFCRLCSSESSVRVRVPYVLQYLVVELAAVGIAMKFKTENKNRHCQDATLQFL